MRKMNCTLEYVNGHIEVYDGTARFFSLPTPNRRRLKNSKTPLNFIKKRLYR